jgi:hypothetical protein
VIGAQGRDGGQWAEGRWSSGRLGRISFRNGHLFLSTSQRCRQSECSRAETAAVLCAIQHLDVARVFHRLSGPGAFRIARLGTSRSLDGASPIRGPSATAVSSPSRTVWGPRPAWGGSWELGLGAGSWELCVGVRGRTAQDGAPGVPARTRSLDVLGGGGEGEGEGEQRAQPAASQAVPGERARCGGGGGRGRGRRRRRPVSWCCWRFGTLAALAALPCTQPGAARARPRLSAPPVCQMAMLL